MKFVVVQKGAREHYLSARALHQRGMLAQLIVDWYAPTKPIVRRIAALLGSWGRAGLAARADGIPSEMVRSFPIRSLIWKHRFRRAMNSKQRYKVYENTDVAFAEATAGLKLPPHEVFLGYSYASLEMLEAEKKRGVFTVLGQIDPGPTHFQIVVEEMRCNPQLAGIPEEFPESYFARIRREWELADLIIVNSEWSRKAIVAEGADANKVEILPLAYEASDYAPNSTLHAPGSEGKLRVLWLGQVVPGKGINYLMQAARLLESEPIRFDVVGPIGILTNAVNSAPSNMIFHGPVGRDRAADWYRLADMFVLPTLSDGFALTQLEALAHGLPVIVTPNCAEVVKDGKTGFVVPARNPRALADAIRKFVDHPELAARMKPACRATVTTYNIEAYGQRLVEIVQSRMSPKKRLSTCFSHSAAS